VRLAYAAPGPDGGPVRQLSSLPPPFFFAAHRFLIAIDSAFRPAEIRPPFLTAAGAFPGAALSATPTGAGAAAAAFAALIAARRFFVPAMIARLPAALP